MDQKIKKYVQVLFSDYPESQQLNELKDEIITNLQARIQESIENGLSQEEAIQKAMKELGDVSELAEEVSTLKKYEVIDQMFNRKPLEKKYTFGYALTTGLLLFGIITALIVFFESKSVFNAIATLFPFTVLSVSVFVFLTLVRETQTQFGMKPLRELFYSLATFLLTSGLFIGSIVYLERVGLKGKIESMDQLLNFKNIPFEAIATFLPFVVPGICILIFLILTEKDRNKPSIWTNLYSSNDQENIQKMIIHGNLSGAIWIFAIGIFLVIGIIFKAWAYSWIIFIFAVGIQLLLEAFYAKKSFN